MKFWFAFEEKWKSFDYPNFKNEQLTIPNVFPTFFAFSSFETTRWPLDEFFQDSKELIDKYYNQKANQYFGLIDSFNYQGHDYDNSKNVTYLVGCYSFHIVIEKCKDSKMKKNDSICERNVCSIFKKEK